MKRHLLPLLVPIVITISWLFVLLSPIGWKPFNRITKCDFLGHDYRTFVCSDGEGKRLNKVRCSRLACFDEPPLAEPWKCPGCGRGEEGKWEK